MVRAVLVTTAVFLFLGLMAISAKAAPIDTLVLFEADEVTDLGPGYWSTDGAFQDAGATDHELVFLFDHVLDGIREIVRDFQSGNGDSSLLTDWGFWEDKFRFEHIGPHPEPPQIIETPIYIEVPPPSEIPLPAAAWLFGSALVGLGWVKRRET